MRIDGIQPGNPLRTGRPPMPDAASSVPSFKETFSKFLNEVNSSQKASSEAKLKLLTGEITDVHQVMNKSEEAKVGFNMLMELRNKALDGYNEVMRLRL
ncbi:MAG: flagellar hook-basal body complex protein FliE [Chitinivibrionales bacterium]|nr:flagellar hook-basal body complex protein FliE [Chitinivibrionales bacterium]